MYICHVLVIKFIISPIMWSLLQLKSYILPLGIAIENISPGQNRTFPNQNFRDNYGRWIKPHRILTKREPYHTNLALKSQGTRGCLKETPCPNGPFLPKDLGPLNQQACEANSPYHSCTSSHALKIISQV